MNVFAKFDEIPSIILEVIKETKRFGHTVGRTFGQRENSIPSHKHSLRGGIKRFYHRVIHPKDAHSTATSEDPDQTAPLGAV